MTPPLVISIPAWGAHYVEMATKYTIPAALASLAISPFTDVTFLIHTDNRNAFQIPAPYKSIVKGVPGHPATHDGNWFAFKQAHRETLVTTPLGGISTLLNSDIVVSVETFTEIARILETKMVAVSVGIRTAIDHSPAPVGATAQQLSEWIWGNLHHISKECIWGKGRSRHPTVVYFEDEGGVVMHGFHLTPMFIKRDGRVLGFKGTIDDDLLYSFLWDEIHFMTDRKCAFAELSPDHKKHPFGETLLNVDGIAGFGRRKFSRAHIRNFQQSFRVLGSGPVDNSAVGEIVERLG